MDKRAVRNNIFVMGLVLLLALITCLGAPPNWVEQAPLSDSTYYYFGQAMEKGLVMYADIFDHKGPLLFVINYIGILISESYGVWLMGFAFMAVYYWFAFKTASLVIDSKLAVVVSAFSMIVLWGCFEKGNYADEYALPFIMYSVYVFIKYLSGKAALANYEVVLNGLCMGCTFLLRANMIGTWLCFALFIIIKMVKEKQGKQLLKLIGLFLTGFLLAVLPFVVYFLIKGYLWEAIYASLIFNFMYTGTSGNGWTEMFRWGYNFLSKYSLVLIFMLYFIITQLKKDQRYFHVCNIIYAFFAFILLCVSKRMYLHYFMVFVPCIIYPCAYIVNELTAHLPVREGAHRKYTGVVVCLALLISMNITRIYDYREVKELWAEKDNIYTEIAHEIEQNSTEQDRIYTHNLNGCIYVESNRLAATRYFALPAVNLDNFPEMKEEFLNDLKVNQPLFIVTDSSYNNMSLDVNRQLQKIIDENYYLYDHRESVKLYRRYE